MVPLFIFYLHIVGLTAAFTSEYRKEGLSAGFLNVGFFVLIFSVGWTISTFALKHLVGAEGWATWMDRDAMSLVLLSAGEAVFFFFYFSDKQRRPLPH